MQYFVPGEIYQPSLSLVQLGHFSKFLTDNDMSFRPSKSQCCMPQLLSRRSLSNGCTLSARSHSLSTAVSSVMHTVNYTTKPARTICLPLSLTALHLHTISSLALFQAPTVDCNYYTAQTGVKDWLHESDSRAHIWLYKTNNCKLCRWVGSGRTDPLGKARICFSLRPQLFRVCNESVKLKSHPVKEGRKGGPKKREGEGWK